MNERLCDPKLQRQLGQDRSCWNVLLVYAASKPIEAGFTARTRSEMEKVSLPGLDRVETRIGVAGVSLRACMDLTRDETVAVAGQFHDRAAVSLKREPHQWLLHEAYLLGSPVDGISDRVAYDDIWPDVIIGGLEAA